MRNPFKKFWTLKNRWHKGKWLFGLFSVLFLFLLPYRRYLDLPTWPFIDTQIYLGFVESLVASLYLALAAYLYRQNLKAIFHSRDIQILAPMQIASAPLIIAQRSIAADHDLRLRLNFRYAGREALAQFGSGYFKFAVASDVALCLFFGQNKSERLQVLPFVKITNHLKLVVRYNSDIQSIEQLKATGGKIGYYANTVHEHFLLNHLNIAVASRLCDLKNILECYDALWADDPIEAFVLWEPHYAALSASARKSIRILDDPATNYDWFLCLVAKEEFLSSEPQIAKRILAMVTESCEVCENDRIDNNSSVVVEECFAFMLAEFTGITKESLRSLAGQNFEFGFARNRAAYMNRMTKLNDVQALIAGATRFSDVKYFWPGLDDL